MGQLPDFLNRFHFLAIRVSWSKTPPLEFRIADFPVEFPVSREFARRRARSPLRRQPGTTSRPGYRGEKHAPPEVDESMNWRTHDTESEYT
jgi:hypothetical protein